MRRGIVVLLIIGLGPIVHAQKPARLDDPLIGDLRIDTSRLAKPCSVGTVVDQIARRASIPFGVENTRDCWLSPRGSDTGPTSEVLTGKTARQAFDHLLGFIPGYRWQQMDGVVVFRPQSAWEDPNNALNLPAAPFTATSMPVHTVLHVLLDAVHPSLLYPHRDMPESVTPYDRSVDFEFPGGATLTALNAVVKGLNGEWELGYQHDDRATIVVHSLEFPGEGVMVPLRLPQARRHAP